MVKEQKFDLLERDWSCRVSGTDTKEDRQTMVLLKREHPYESIAGYLAGFRLLLAFGVGSGKEWDAIRQLYKFATVSNLSKSPGYSHHVLHTLIGYKKIDLKSAFSAIAKGMLNKDLTSFSFDFLLNSDLNLDKGELIKIGLSSSILESLKNIDLENMNQSYQDQLMRHKGHDLADIIVEYLNNCSYDEAVKVSDIILNGKIYPFDLNSTFRIFDKASNLATPKFFWSPVHVIIGFKPTEIKDSAQNVNGQDKKFPQVRPNCENYKEWEPASPGTLIPKLHQHKYDILIKSEVDGHTFTLGHRRISSHTSSHLRSRLGVFHDDVAYKILCLGNDRLLIVDYRQAAGKNAEIVNMRTKKVILKTEVTRRSIFMYENLREKLKGKMFNLKVNSSWLKKILKKIIFNFSMFAAEKDISSNLYLVHIVFVRV